MSDTDRAKVLWIVSLIGLVLSSIVLFVRGFLRWRVLGLDDFTLLAAQVFAFGQYGALFTSLHYGLGTSSEMLPVESRSNVSKSAFASQMLTILSLGFSKCSLVFLIRRRFARETKNCWLTCNILISVICVWLIGAELLASVGCDVDKYIPPEGNATCVVFAARWNLIIALDVISELLLIGLPVYFVWSMEMKLSRKGAVVLAFALRLPVAAFVIVFSILFTAVNISPHRGEDVSTALAWQQAEVAYALISATMPCLRWCVGTVTTNFEVHKSMDRKSRYQNSTKGSKSQTHSIPGPKESFVQAAIKLTTLRPSRPADFQKEPKETDGRNIEHHVGRLRPEKLTSSTVISGGIRSRSRDSARSQAGSQDFIIRRDVRFQVDNVCAFGERSSVYEEK